MQRLEPDERTTLAGEYVLGTLEPERRRQAEALLQQDVEFRREVWWWERRFAPLGLRLRPVSPPPMVWLGIQREIAARAPTPLRRRPPRAVTVWALTATAASLALAVALVLQIDRPLPAPQVVVQRVEVPVPVTSYVALLQMPESTMHWTVSATPDRRQLVVHAGGEPPASIAGRAPELWVITPEGPVSLGLLPASGDARRELPANIALASGRVLAVSLEPPGGSPTGQPTGPVVTTAPMLQAS